MISGSQPETAKARIAASGSRPWRAAYSGVVTRQAAAPSVSGEDVPAVTLPSARNAGASVASTSAVVAGRRQPSTATSCPSARTGVELGVQATCRTCLGGLALRLDGERLLALARARRSARRLPRRSRPSRGRAADRTPPGRDAARSRRRRAGTRVIDSTPAATYASPMPSASAPAAVWIGLHRRAAEAVDRWRRRRSGEPGEDAGDAPEVHALLALRERAAHRHVLDRRAVHGAALDQRAHHLAAQLVGPHAGELALVRGRERRARVAGDHRPRRHSARSVQRRVSAWIARQWRRRTIGRKIVNHVIIPAGIRNSSVTGLVSPTATQIRAKPPIADPAEAPVAAVEHADLLVVGGGHLLGRPGLAALAHVRLAVVELALLAAVARDRDLGGAAAHGGCILTGRRERWPRRPVRLLLSSREGLVSSAGVAGAGRLQRSLRLVLDHDAVDVQRDRDHEHDQAPAEDLVAAGVAGQAERDRADDEVDDVEHEAEHRERRPHRPEPDRPRPARPVLAQEQEPGDREDVRDHVAEVRDGEDLEVAAAGQRSDRDEQQHEVEHRVQRHRVAGHVVAVELAQPADRHAVLGDAVEGARPVHRGRVHREHDARRRA